MDPILQLKNEVGNLVENYLTAGEWFNSLLELRENHPQFTYFLDNQDFAVKCLRWFKAEEDFFLNNFPTYVAWLLKPESSNPIISGIREEPMLIAAEDLIKAHNFDALSNLDFTQGTFEESLSKLPRVYSQDDIDRLEKYYNEIVTDIDVSEETQKAIAQKFLDNTLSGGILPDQPYEAPELSDRDKKIIHQMFSLVLLLLALKDDEGNYIYQLGDLIG